MVSLPTVAAAPVEYISEAFSDTTGKWINGANIYDGDWGTYGYYASFVTADEYPCGYAYNFDSAASGSGSIAQVDIIVRQEITGLDASDQWGISLDVGASTGTYLQAMNTANYALNNLTFTDVTEPNGGGWIWAEVQTAQIHFDCNKVGGGDKAQWDIYEISFRVTTVSGNDYTAYPDGDFSLTGETSLIADFVKTLVEGVTLAGETSLIAGFVKALVEGFSLTGETSLIAGFVKALVEGFTLAGTTSLFVIIQKIIAEGFGLTGDTSLAVSYSVLLATGFVLVGAAALAANFSVRLSVGFSLGGTVALAASYIKNLAEGFTLADTVSAFKVFIADLVDGFTVGVESNIEKIAGMVLVGSMFYQLFFGLNMWGYLGPLALVIGGYFIAKKDRFLGVLYFVVECLLISHYLTLVEATPDYWWHIFILLLGGLFTCVYPLWGNKL